MAPVHILIGYDQIGSFVNTVFFGNSFNEFPVGQYFGFDFVRLEGIKEFSYFLGNSLISQFDHKMTIATFLFLYDNFHGAFHLTPV